MEENVRAHVRISGRVQGVFFRMETQRQAERLGLFGWVKNCADGTVEAVFEGDRTTVDDMLRWCKKGPPLATVDRVDLEWEAFGGGFRGFEVRY